MWWWEIIIISTFFVLSFFRSFFFFFFFMHAFFTPLCWQYDGTNFMGHCLNVPWKCFSNLMLHTENEVVSNKCGRRSFEAMVPNSWPTTTTPMTTDSIRIWGPSCFPHNILLYDLSMKTDEPNCLSLYFITFAFGFICRAREEKHALARTVT